MYNSIQYFLEFGIKKIENNIKDFMGSSKDFGEFVLKLEDNLHELGRNIVTEVLEDLDKIVKADEERKNEWSVVKKDEIGSVTTIFGKSEYKRTYYKSKKDGRYSHLADEMVGINPHERLSTDVVVRALEEAADASYRKSGQKAVLTEDISKQTVMNMVRGLEKVKYEANPNEEKKKVRVLYVEADEDHVALQSGGICMPKLVYVHEGLELVEWEDKRRKLHNAKYFGGLYENSEELWLEVAQYIDDVYDVESIEKIYIAGDGAAWIKQGLNWIVKSKFVLDKYHLTKYMIKATGHMDEYRQELKDALDEADKPWLIEVFKKILSKTEQESKRKAVLEAKRYMLNNWDGIEIYETDKYDVVGCSAEGHVSHIFSDRLSSRPRGWCKTSVDRMARLRIYIKNGGKVIDLVLAQKKKEEKEKQKKISKEFQEKVLRTAKMKYNGNYNNVTVLNIGRKTQLYQGLKALRDTKLA
jgi:hypothetical protein